MDILHRTLFAGLLGCFLALALAVLSALAVLYWLGELHFGSIIPFSRLTLILWGAISLVVVPVSAKLGLVYAVIRRAVRVGVEQGIVAASDR